MSFEYTCYYILTKGPLKIDSSIYGDISGPFSKTEITSHGLGLSLPSATSIIAESISNPSNTFVVGLPNKNMNMISKNIETYLKNIKKDIDYINNYRTF